MLFYPLLIRPLKHLDFTSLFGFLRCACFWLGIGWKKSEQTSQPVATQGFSEGLAAVQKGERWGYMDKSGKEVIPAAYYDASDFQSGIAPVMFVMRPDLTWAYIRARLKNVKTPKRRIFRPHASPIFLAIHPVSLRKIVFAWRRNPSSLSMFPFFKLRLTAAMNLPFHHIWSALMPLPFTTVRI